TTSTNHEPPPVASLRRVVAFVGTGGRLRRNPQQETTLASEIGAVEGEISVLRSKKARLETALVSAGELRRLLYEQGHPLEQAVLEALSLFGFEASTLAEGDSEFDAVFASAEGRFLGEVEGKDSRAINVDKFSQLERNLHEDFSRDSVETYAKGVLFGNAYRLVPLAERGEFFTKKAIASAKRIQAALVRTPDLFLPAKYLREHPDESYSCQCRRAILTAEGEIVMFPIPPQTDA
ncbi:MAG TPA: hypothetical protein VOA80_04445, partial [Thermoanaerobaculia bacterium]|nr:hypothetical protein [Thermoanaerobaculia bacterium]